MSDQIPLRLAVDFDGVCHDPTNKLPGYKLGQPIKGAQEALQGLKKEGAIIVIHSVWADTEQKCEAISKWCRFFDIPYDFITNQKPVADAYIDNLAIRFYNWNQTIKDIKDLT
jgi:hypothetical protein